MAIILLDLSLPVTTSPRYIFILKKIFVWPTLTYLENFLMLQPSLETFLMLLSCVLRVFSFTSTSSVSSTMSNIDACTTVAACFLIIMRGWGYQFLQNILPSNCSDRMSGKYLHKIRDHQQNYTPIRRHSKLETFKDLAITLVCSQGVLLWTTTRILF